MTQKVGIKEALSPGAVQETVTEIQTYLWEENASDAKERIKDEISDQFWETIIDSDKYPGENVPYESLADEAKDQIGYKESEDDDVLPWWLADFEWYFESTGDGAFSIPDDDLEQLTSFDSHITKVNKPEYTGGSGRENLDELIDGIVTVRDRLVAQTDIDNPNDLISGEEKEYLPDQIFEFEDESDEDESEHSDTSRMVTKPEFREWLEGLVSLCPPFNQTTTALTWYNVGLPTHAVEDLGVDVDLLTNVGLTDGDKDDEHVYSREHRRAFTNIMQFRGVFDREVDVGTGDTEMGAGLEPAYIDAWASETNQLDDEKQETIRICGTDNVSELDDDERSQRAPHCLELPVWNDYGRGYYPTFDTQKRKGRYGKLSRRKSDAQLDRSNAIVSTLESRYNLLVTENDG